MRRRDVLSRRNDRSVKLSLLAATIALSLGFWAEHALETRKLEQEAASMVHEIVPAVEPETIAG